MTILRWGYHIIGTRGRQIAICRIIATAFIFVFIGEGTILWVISAIHIGDAGLLFHLTGL